MTIPLLLGLLVLALQASWSVAAADEPGPPAARGHGPYLGARLDWSTDSPAAFRGRLGLAPAVYGYDAPLPLGRRDIADLHAALDAAKAEGAGLLVTLRPTETPVSALDGDAVTDLVSALSEAGVGGTVPVWLRPMPEMNGSWETWGQQPTSFVDVFRRLAESVHARLPRTAMVWQPAYAAGYPFEGRAGDTPAARAAQAALDTTGDGRVTSDDDPYGPYWPGKEAVDWVGMSLYHFSDSRPVTRNTRPAAGELQARLSGRYGFPDQAHRGQRDFYDRFVRTPDRPMLVETSALYASSLPGADEGEVKHAWFDQVRAAVADPRYPGIGMVLWLEVRRPETEAADRVVDWRATHRPELAASFRDRLVRGGRLTTGPSGRSRAAAAESGRGGEAAAAAGTVLRGRSGVLAASGAGALAAGVLALAWCRSRSRSRDLWLYPPGDEARDLRIDLLRGMAICFVVVDHVDIPSLWQLLTQELIGPVSGAELFVSLSGVVLGVVYRGRVAGPEQWYDSAVRMWRRALKLWVTALVVITGVYLVALLPGVDARVVTTFTDPGAGGGGQAGGRVYDLYAGFSTLADFPVPGWALRDVLLLRMGPSQVNIIGLYVVLLLLAPLMTWLLLRRRWMVVLAASAGLYGLYQVYRVRVLPAQFEDPFPLLAWQVLFVLGLVAGWHRAHLLEAARRPLGRAVLGLAVLAALAFALFSWNNPALSNGYDVRLALLPDATFERVYGEWFTRTSLGVGRLLASVCFLVTAYVVLSAFWVPIARVSGWLLIPLGQATLYVFVLHVLFVVAVANVPVLTSSVLLGTLTHAVILLTLWAMVRTRFLFGLVPR